VAAAILIAGIAGILTFNYLVQIRAESIPSERVLVARVDMYPGDLITPDHIEAQTVPEGILPADHLRKPSEAVGRVVILPIFTHEVILSGKLAGGPSTTLSSRLPDGRWAMVLPGAWLASPLPELTPGDQLDLIAYQSGQSVESAGLIASAVQVLATEGTSINLDPLTIAVSFEQAQIILFSRANGFSILPLLRPKDG
jgi:Flp pilus assembly protein CpaB